MTSDGKYKALKDFTFESEYFLPTSIEKGVFYSLVYLPQYMCYLIHDRDKAIAYMDEIKLKEFLDA